MGRLEQVLCSQNHFEPVSLFTSLSYEKQNERCVEGRVDMLDEANGSDAVVGEQLDKHLSTRSFKHPFGIISMC